MRRFEKRGLLERTRSKADGRQSLLALTRRGHEAFAPLHTRSRDEIGAMLGALPAAEQDRLVDAMRAIEGLLGARPEPKAPYMLRPHQPGDMGWVIHRHAVLYAREYGWDERFEAMVAEIAARFIQGFDPKRERCFMAEKDGEIVGSVFLVAHGKTVAQLRLLLVEPGRAGSASARASSPSASASRGRRATGRSRSGPTASSWPRGASTRARAIGSCARSRITASATTWSGRRGI